MKKYSIPVYFGLLHGFNDCIGGMLLSFYSMQSNATAVVYAYFAYSLLAFGGQLPIGWLLDKQKNFKPFIFLSFLLLIASVLSAPHFLWMAIILSGIASALIHVTGGTICFLQDTKSTMPAGIFTAPGVLGLILGGIAGTSMSINLFYACAPVLMLFFLLVTQLELPSYTSLDKKEAAPVLETHDYIMLVLLLAIAMRSMIWNILNMLAGQHDIKWLLAIGISAFAGKLFGGYIAEKADWKKYIFISIGISAVLLNAGSNSLPVFCAGILLLQSAVPITLWIMQQYLRKQPAMSTAWSLGVAIILAGLPAYMNQFRSIQQDKKFLLAIFVLLITLNGVWVIKTRQVGTKPN